MLFARVSYRIVLTARIHHLYNTCADLKRKGCYESVDCSTGMEWWNGILE